MEEVKERGGLSGSTVKIIAVAAMLIDHTAAVVLVRMLRTEWNEGIYGLYSIMRDIGRLGFPIFCFLLVEGFQRSKNLKKYALRLGIFALISEIPFDLAITGHWFHSGYQNVYFTLLLGLMALCAFRFIERHMQVGAEEKITGVRRVQTVVACLAAMAVCMILAEVLCTDYAGMGVLTICVMYSLRRWRVLSMAAGWGVLCAMSLTELPAFFAILPILLYNGRRGLKMKYFFYVFYPLHLLLLYLITVLMGMGEMSLL